MKIQRAVHILSKSIYFAYFVIVNGGKNVIVKTPVSTLKRIVLGWERFERILAYVAALIAIVMAFTVAYEVVMRYFFDSATRWSTSLNLYLLIFFVFLGGAYTGLTEGHVRVDIMYTRFSHKWKGIIGIFITALSFFFIIYLTISCAQVAYRSYEMELRSIQAMRWPLFPMHLMMAIGSLLLGIELLSQIIKHIASLIDS